MTTKKDDKFDEDAKKIAEVSNIINQLNGLGKEAIGMALTRYPQMVSQVAVPLQKLAELVPRNLPRKKTRKTTLRKRDSENSATSLYFDLREQVSNDRVENISKDIQRMEQADIEHALTTGDAKTVEGVAQKLSLEFATDTLKCITFFSVF